MPSEVRFEKLRGEGRMRENGKGLVRGVLYMPSSYNKIASFPLSRTCSLAFRQST